MKSSLEAFMNSTSDSVYIIGHASALLRINKKLVIFDPAWNYQPFSEYWKLCPPQVNCNSIMFNIDACVVSHIHDDHYNPKILKTLQCPVYIMSGRPEFTEKMQSLCKEVYEIKPRENYEILDGVSVRFLPSSFNPVDSSCFVFSDRFSFYHGNDNFVSIDDIKESIIQIGSTDVACVPYAYLNWYPECMEDYSTEKKKSETERLVQKMIDFSLDLISSLRTKNAIPAGANLYYSDDIDSPMNKMGITPWEFRRRCPSDLQYKIKCMTAGDYIIGEKNTQFRNEETFLKDVSECLKNSQPKSLTAEVIPRPEYITRIQEKLKKARHIVANHVVVFPIADWFLLVSLETLQCCYTKVLPNHGNKTIITIEPYQLKEWLDGRMTYEMVVATRKFKMRREPDEYNVKVFEFILNYL